MNEFKIDFVEHTKDVLENYAGKNEVSNLLNCTLGLIILPYENVKDSTDAFWGTEVHNIKGLPSFTTHHFDPILKIKKGVIKPYPKTLKVLLQKIRNGLAHQNIEPVTHNQAFKGVIIRNYFDKTHCDLKLEFTTEELKQFALFIAGEY